MALFFVMRPDCKHPDPSKRIYTRVGPMRASRRDAIVTAQRHSGRVIDYSDGHNRVVYDVLAGGEVREAVALL